MEEVKKNSKVVVLRVFSDENDTLPYILYGKGTQGSLLRFTQSHSPLGITARLLYAVCPKQKIKCRPLIH